MSIVAHLRELGHRLPVGPHRRQRRRARVRLGEPVVAARDREARRHPLHVVLERPGQRLVEVVQVEQQPPLGRGERAEVRQVRIAAQLGLQPGHRRVLQVRRHDLGRAPVEGERRDHHPAVAHRHQVRLPGGVLLLQQARPGPAVRGRAPTWYGSTAASGPGPPCPSLCVRRCSDARSSARPSGPPPMLTMAPSTARPRPSPADTRDRQDPARKQSHSSLAPPSRSCPAVTKRASPSRSDLNSAPNSRLAWEHRDQCQL